MSTKRKNDQKWWFAVPVAMIIAALIGNPSFITGFFKGSQEAVETRKIGEPQPKQDELVADLPLQGKKTQGERQKIILLKTKYGRSQGVPKGLGEVYATAIDTKLPELLRDAKFSVETKFETSVPQACAEYKKARRNNEKIEPTWAFMTIATGEETAYFRAYLISDRVCKDQTLTATNNIAQGEKVEMGWSKAIALCFSNNHEVGDIASCLSAIRP